MLSLLLALVLMPAAQLGPFQLPDIDRTVPTEVSGILAQPGLGPEMLFDPNRWEWWFDFNQEVLLRLRARLERNAAADGGAPWRPISDDLRTSAVLPALVEAVRADPPALPGVRRNPNPRDVRGAGVMAMGRLARPEAVPYIELVAETDPDRNVRMRAVVALGFSGSPNAVETLVRLYGDETVDAEIRTYAAAGLGLIGNAQAVDALRTGLSEKLLTAQGNQIRAGSLYAAGLPGDAVLGAALRELQPSWLFKKEPQARALIGASLGRVGDPPSVAFLFELLNDSDTQVRRSAAAGFGAAAGQLDAGAIGRLVAHYAQESDSATRMNLIHALGRARLPESRAWLRAALASENAEARPHIALALGMDGDQGNTPVLLEALNGQNEQSIAGAMVVGLGLLGNDSATDALVARLDTESSPYLRGYLCLALGLIDPARPELADEFDRIARTESDVELIRSAILGLGLLGARGRIDALAADAGTLGNTMERASVLHALGLVGDAATVAPLLNVFHDTEQTNYVRAYALQALGELCDPRPISPCGRLSEFVEMNHEVGFVFELYRLL